MNGYLVFDTETTGLPDWSKPSEAEGQPRLASWCMIFVRDDFSIEYSFSALVKPNGWTMPAEAQAINRLSTEKLAAYGQSVEWPLSLMQLALAQQRTFVAHGLSFDCKILRGEFRRAGLTGVAEWIRPGASGICTMERATPVCAIPHPTRHGRQKWPKLAEACQIILGETLGDEAHDARFDAHACLRLLMALSTRECAGAMRKAV